METKHTSGPWYIQDYPDKTTDIFAKGSGIQIAGIYCTDFADGMANANLIASAPELLEACKIALETINKELPATTFAPRQWLADVIAKAEGK